MESISLGEFRILRDSGINILDSRPTSLLLLYFLSMAAVSFLLTKNIITTDITGGLSAMLVDSPDLEI